MALSKTISIEGVTHVMTEYGMVRDGKKSISLNAYIKVESVTANKTSAQATVSFTDGSKAITKSYVFTPEIDGNNFIKQAYEHLKTLPEFDNAENC